MTLFRTTTAAVSSAVVVVAPPFLHLFVSLLLLLLLSPTTTATTDPDQATTTTTTTAATALSSLRRNPNNDDHNNGNNNNNNKNKNRGLIVSPRRDRRPKIIGGEPTVDVDPDRYPYFALMDGSALCGAVLISRRFVLTAAHCVGADDDFAVGISETTDGYGTDFTSLLESWFGEKKKTNSDDRDDDNGNGYDVEEHPYLNKVRHWAYDSDTMDADIALYELERDVPDDLRPIRLDDTETMMGSGTPLTAIGFGDTNPSNWIDAASDELREVTVGYLDRSECAAYYGGGGGGGSTITDGMLCARSPDGGDTCQGDSGGPLFRKGDSPEEDVLVGITSWGIDCGGDYPGVYARISFYRDWIVSCMCNLNPSAVPSYVDCDDDVDLSICNNGNAIGGNGNNNNNNPAWWSDHDDNGFDDDDNDDGFDDDDDDDGFDDDDDLYYYSDDDDLYYDDDLFGIFGSDSAGSFIDNLIDTVTGWFSGFGL